MMKQGKCKNCGIIPVVIEKPNHILHLLLSICTLGIWFLVWLLLINKVKCQKCGRDAKELGFFDRYLVKNRSNNMNPDDNISNSKKDFIISQLYEKEIKSIEYSDFEMRVKFK